MVQNLFQIDNKQRLPPRLLHFDRASDHCAAFPGKNRETIKNRENFPVFFLTNREIFPGFCCINNPGNEKTKLMLGIYWHITFVTCISFWRKGCRSKALFERARSCPFSSKTHHSRQRYGQLRSRKNVTIFLIFCRSFYFSKTGKIFPVFCCLTGKIFPVF